MRASKIWIASMTVRNWAAVVCTARLSGPVTAASVVRAWAPAIAASRASMTSALRQLCAIKLPEGRGPRPLHGAERRPVGEEITRLDGGDLADPVERLRKILLQQTCDPIGQGHALVDDVAALFTERLQGPALDRVGHPRAQLVAMADHQVQQQLGVERIVLGPAGPEGLAITRQRLRVNRIEHDPVGHQQRVHDRAFPLLERHRDLAARKPLLQLPPTRAAPPASVRAPDARSVRRPSADAPNAARPPNPARCMRRRLPLRYASSPLPHERAWRWSCASPIGVLRGSHHADDI